MTVVQPPAGCKDVTDMFAAGKTLDDLETIVSAAAEPVPVWTGEPGHTILEEVHAELRKYVVLPSAAATDALTLFVAATHAQPVWEHATRFVLKSPQKRCGKSRAQEVAAEMMHEPLRTSNISVAALVRSISEADPPVLILDEADTVFAKRRGERSEGAEDLRGILNAGHGRGCPYIRWNPNTNTPQRCPTFAMAMLGGIGDLPDTIEDRAVVVTMRRRAPSEKVAPYRTRRAHPTLHAIRNRLHAWICTHRGQLAVAEPELPVEDRAADVWEPLVAVADLAGGDWPQRARNACRELTASTDADDMNSGERLLADIRAVFGTEDRLPTATLIDRLADIEESPWGDWYGKRITPRSIANLLKPYGIRSKNVRTTLGEQAKGFLREDFEDAWRRYSTRPAGCSVPAVPPSHTLPDSLENQQEPPGTESGTDEYFQCVPPETQVGNEYRVTWDGGTAGTDSLPQATQPTPDGFGICSQCGAKCASTCKTCPRCLAAED